MADRIRMPCTEPSQRLSPVQIQYMHDLICMQSHTDHVMCHTDYAQMHYKYHAYINWSVCAALLGTTQT